MPPADSGRHRLITRGVVLLEVLTLLSAVGLFAERVHATTLVSSGLGYAADTPDVTLDYGGGSRYVVDDSVGTLHPILFSVRNAGRSTMTLQGVDDFLGTDVAGFRLSRLAADGGDRGIDTAPRLALRGFRLRPGQQVGLWMYVKGQGCVSSAEGAATTISSVPVTVSVLGITRVEWVSLPLLVTVMNNPTAGARSDPRSCLRSDIAPATS